MTVGSVLGLFKPRLKYGRFYFLILIAMPNWNYNDVTIHAPEHDVREFIYNNHGDLCFNMPKLFPERFPDDDPTGAANWNEERACENT